MSSSPFLKSDVTSEINVFGTCFISSKVNSVKGDLEKSHVLSFQILNHLSGKKVACKYGCCDLLVNKCTGLLFSNRSKVTQSV